MTPEVASCTYFVSGFQEPRKRTNLEAILGLDRQTKEVALWADDRLVDLEDFSAAMDLKVRVLS